MADNANDLQSVQTTVTRGSDVVLSQKIVTDPSGSARIDIQNSAGQPTSTETLTVRNGKQTVQVIDYTRRAWWTLTPTSTLHIQGPSPAQITTDLASGGLHIEGSRTVAGRNELELSGTPPSVFGSTVTILVDPNTDLPLSSTAYEAGGVIVESQYQWLAPNVSMVAQFTPSIPAGFAHLVLPPTGVPTGGLG